MPGRPARAAARKARESYVAALALNDSGSDGSGPEEHDQDQGHESGEAEPGPSQQRAAKGKGKARGKRRHYSEDDDSAEEFKIEEQGLEGEEEDEDEGDLERERSAGSGDEGPIDEPDGSIAGTSDDEGTRRSKGKRRAKSSTGGQPIAKTTILKPAGMRGGGTRPKSTKPRDTPNAKTPQYSYRAIHGLFMPPKIRLASSPWPRHGLPEIEEGQPMDLQDQWDASRVWTALARVPKREALKDMGWFPGKRWTVAENEKLTSEIEDGMQAVEGPRGERAREVAGKPFVHPRLDIPDVDVLDDQAARPYLDAALHTRHDANMDADADGEMSTSDEHPGHLGGGGNARQSGANAYSRLFEEVHARPDPFVCYMGPPDAQEKVEIRKHGARRLDSIGDMDEEGHVFNTGGFVYSLDWCPTPMHLCQGKEYLAVSVSPEAEPHTPIGTRLARPAPGMIQVWSVSCDADEDDGKEASAAVEDPDGDEVVDAAPADEETGRRARSSASPGKGSATLEMVVCVDVGSAWELSWCPVGQDYRSKVPGTGGTGIRRLGILAGTFMDGSVSLFSIPHPDDVRASRPDVVNDGPLHVKLSEPVLSLDIPDTAAWSFSWAGGERIAAGCSNGWVAVWNVGKALRSGSKTARPTHYFQIHDSAVSSIIWQMVPPTDADGKMREDHAPSVLVTAGYDGSNCMVDISDPWTSAVANHGRETRHEVGWNAMSQTFLMEGSDNYLRQLSSRPEEYGQTRSVSVHHGRILSIATSGLHPFAATGSADGSVVISNVVRNLRKPREGETKAVHKLFRLDYNRRTGEYRILDTFMPEGLANDVSPANGGTGAGGQKGFAPYALTGSWSPNVAVRSVAWSPNIGRGLLLACGTAAGIVRVDWMER